MTLFSFLIIYRNPFLGENIEIISFVLQFFFRITSRVQRFCKFWWLHRINCIKNYQIKSNFYPIKHLQEIKNRIFQVKIWEIQIIRQLLRDNPKNNLFNFQYCFPKQKITLYLCFFLRSGKCFRKILPSDLLKIQKELRAKNH